MWLDSYVRLYNTFLKFLMPCIHFYFHAFVPVIIIGVFRYECERNLGFHSTIT
jgi:hypothetical protein